MRAWLSAGAWPRWEAGVRKLQSESAPHGGTPEMEAFAKPLPQNNDKLPTDGVSHGSRVWAEHLQAPGRGRALLGEAGRSRPGPDGREGHQEGHQPYALYSWELAQPVKPTEASQDQINQNILIRENVTLPFGLTGYKK